MTASTPNTNATGATSLPWALEQLSGLTPYYRLTVGTVPAGAHPTSALWRDRDLLESTIDSWRQRMAVNERRVAASTLFFGYAARLWSLALGTSTLTGRCLDLDPDRLMWTTTDIGMELHTATVDFGADPAHEVLARQLEPFVDALSGVVARGLLWGNAASALSGSTRLLPGAQALANRLHDHPRLRPALDPHTGQRHSCCLFYRAPTGSYCTDCALTSPPPLHGGPR